MNIFTKKLDHNKTPYQAICSKPQQSILLFFTCGSLALFASDNDLSLREPFLANMPISWYPDDNDRSEGTPFAPFDFESRQRNKRHQPFSEESLLSQSSSSSHFEGDDALKRQRLLTSSVARVITRQHAHGMSPPHEPFLNEVNRTLFSYDHAASSGSDPATYSVSKKAKVIPESRCPHDCSFSTTNISAWVTHLKNLHNITTPDCPYNNCSHKAKDRTQLYSHIRHVHSDARPFECEHPGCTSTFKKREHLNTHQLTHSTEKTVVCTHPGCASKFKTERSLKRHLKAKHACMQSKPNSVPPELSNDVSDGVQLDRPDHQSADSLDFDSDADDAEAWLRCIFSSSPLPESSSSSSSIPETVDALPTLDAPNTGSGNCQSEACIFVQSELARSSPSDGSGLRLKFIEETIYTCPLNCGMSTASIRTWANHLQSKHSAAEGRCPFEHCSYYRAGITDSARKLLYRHIQDKHPTKHLLIHP